MNAIGACYRMSREKTNTLERNGFFGQFRHFHWLLYHRNECATYELRASYPLICSPSLQYSVPLEPFYFICENFLYRSIKHCFLLQLICVSFVLICEFSFFRTHLFSMMIYQTPIFHVPTQNQRMHYFSCEKLSSIYCKLQNCYCSKNSEFVYDLTEWGKNNRWNIYINSRSKDVGTFFKTLTKESVYTLVCGIAWELHTSATAWNNADINGVECDCV